jgi:PAS domain S-box-containing protein
MTEKIIFNDSLSCFKKRLVISVALLNLLVFSLASFSMYQSKINYEKQAAISTQNISKIINQNIYGEIDKIDLALITAKTKIEEQLVLGKSDKKTIDKYLVFLHSNLPSTSAMRMADSKGDLAFGTGLTPGVVVNINDRDYFKLAQDNTKDELIISKATLGRVTKRLVINVARRVNNPNGSFAGIIFCSLTIDHFNKFFSGIDVGKKGSLTLRDNDLALITRYPEIDNTKGSKAVSKEFIELYKAGNNSATFRALAGIDKTERMITYRKVFDYPFVTVVALAKDEYLAEWRNELKTQLGLVALFTIVTVASYIMLLNRWKKEKLIASELRKSRDEFELRVEQRTIDLNKANENLINELHERKQAEIACNYSQSHYQSLFENSLIGVAVTDRDFIINEVNDAFCNLLGYSKEELVGIKRISDVSHPDDADKSIEMVKMLVRRDVDHYVFEKRYISKSGNTIDVLIYVRGLYNLEGEYEGSVASVLDLTERKQAEMQHLKLEQQLLHAQKLESLGVLAGGIAHDFNNILTTIIGNADLALMRINPESSAIENLHSIEKAAARAADLAKQMLAYSGKGKFIISNHDINGLLEEMLHILQVSISKKAVLRLNLTRPLPSVEVDATQIRQIIMNLVINASEAIGDKSGVIAISTGCMDCDCSYLKDVWLDENIGDGLYVYIEIADTGCGMNKETLTKLFDPFFTTKFTGRGLGMAAVLGIVRGHKGAVKVYSEPGKGSSFKILLPASGKPADIFNLDAQNDHWKGSGTVLLVDDEETIRGMGAEMLKLLGFSVVTANDGREAVEVYKASTDISFVILDLTMPHMDGEQCFRELRKLNPDVKVIMSSGFSEMEVTQKFVGKGLAGFIQKPYKFSALRESIMGLCPENIN